MSNKSPLDLNKYTDNFFNKWVFRIFFILAVIFFIFIVFDTGLNNKYGNIKCPTDTQCENPLYWCKEEIGVFNPNYPTCNALKNMNFNESYYNIMYLENGMTIKSEIPYLVKIFKVFFIFVLPSFLK